MKISTLFLIVLAAVFFTSCESDNTTETNTSTIVETPQNTPPPTSPTAATGRFNPPKPAGNTSFEKAFLEGIWVFEFYVDPSSRENSDFNRGRWYQFKADGSFTSGHWQEQTANGSWKVFQREDKWLLFVDSTIDSQDAEFELTVNKEADAMSWVGTSTFKAYDPIMLKVIQLTSLPTKKQFGVE